MRVASEVAGPVCQADNVMLDLDNHVDESHCAHISCRTFVWFR